MKLITPKIILVDMDGTIANYQERLFELLAAEYPDMQLVPVAALIEHDTDKNYPLQYRGQIEALTHSHGFYRSLPIIQGAREALEYLLSLGHDVHICTAPKRKHAHCVLEKYDWVLEHLGQEWVERMIVTRDKTLVHGDILIDDKPNITGICTPSWQQVFYDQPYNRQFTDRPRITWANYREVLQL